jgi:phospholipase A-2-activating protein
VSGSRDATVGVWATLFMGDPGGSPTWEMTRQLKGHQYQVTAVAVIPSAVMCSDKKVGSAIVSASLDKTVRIWNSDGECQATLQGHDGAVLSLAVITPLQKTNSAPDTVPQVTYLVTGSGDCTIRLWSVSTSLNRCIDTIKAHTDSVRCLAAIPGGTGFVSASHDGTIKVWQLDADDVNDGASPTVVLCRDLVGHTALVYSASVSPDGSLVISGSEDNTAKLWSLIDGRCIQTIQHPGCVWSTEFLPNGDFVTACSDGVARVWSSATERTAPESQIEEFRSSCDAFLAPKQTTSGLPEGLKVEDPAVLQAPGAHDGQTVVVAEGGAGGAGAYVWNASGENGGEWERLGEVIAGPERKMHQGKEWDHIFDVDVADGVPPLKLAMDEGENPYVVADRFIADNDLPSEYKEQIVEFILRNTGTGSGGQVASAPAHSQTFVDPYTGHAAYVPPPPSSSQRGTSESLGTGGQITGGGVDPFTGRPSIATLGSLPSDAMYYHTVIPAKEYLCFDTPPPIEGLRKKINEFNRALQLNSVSDGGSIGSQQDKLLLLVRPAEIPPDAYDIFEDTAFSQILKTWPVVYLFPWLDIARVAALSPDGARVLSKPQVLGEMRADEGPEGSLGRSLATVLLTKVAEESTSAAVPSQQVALRFLANCFVQPSLRPWVASQMEVLLNDDDAPTFAPTFASISSTSKGVRLGLATLLLNYAVFLNKSPRDEVQGKKGVVGVGVRLLRGCTCIGASEKLEEESIVRCMVALGTVMMDHSQVRVAARDAGLLPLLKDICSTCSGQGEENVRLKQVASQVIELVRL